MINTFVDMFQSLKYDGLRKTCARSDVNVNDDESLHLEYEDEVVSFEQLESNTESDLSECSSVSIGKSKSSSSFDLFIFPCLTAPQS